jgi:hypothetical protein
MRLGVLVGLLLLVLLGSVWGCSSPRSTEPVTKAGSPFERLKKPGQ